MFRTLKLYEPNKFDYTVQFVFNPPSTNNTNLTEAEYIAACEAAKEAVWIRNFITGLGMVPSIADPIDISCDNNGAIAHEKEPRSHSMAKHILRKYHLIREINGRGDIHIYKVHTNDNVADPLTTALSQQKHESHTSSIVIRYMNYWL